MALAASIAATRSRIIDESSARKTLTGTLLWGMDVLSPFGACRDIGVG